MKKTLLTGIALALTFAISSCDDDTTTIGNSLTNTADLFTFTTDTFNVISRSITVDSVLSRSEYSYIGRVKDPETGTYVTSDYMTQFTILENEAGMLFPDSTRIINKEGGRIVADSCYLNVIVNAWQGDSLAAMKLTAYELLTPVADGKKYYTNFDPTADYVRTNGGLKQSKVYSIVDLQLSDSMRAVRQSGSYMDYISIPLKGKYIDVNGKTYNNYGTYILRQYYDHPEYFTNSLMFTKHVCPGFYFKTTDGIGLMSEVSNTQLVIYYDYQNGDDKSVGAKTFTGTEEVLQTTHITNDRSNIDRLAADSTCTYLKTPAGIFTEVTLPVDDIKKGHENDTITSAKIVFHRMNDSSTLSSTLLKEPENLLMIERDSLFSFFENERLTDNITSYMASYSSSNNTYTFNNISGLVSKLYSNKKKGGSNFEQQHPNWNKVVLIPVKTITTTQSSYYTSSTTVTGITNEMSMTSVRLIGGYKNSHAPIQISVIYNASRK